MIEDTETWVQLTDDEAAALQALTVDAKGLDDESIKRLRAEGEELITRSFKAFVERQGYYPEQHELDLMAEAVVAYLNEHRVPDLHAHSVAGRSLH